MSDHIMKTTLGDLLRFAQIFLPPDTYLVVESHVEKCLRDWAQTWRVLKPWLLETDLELPLEQVIRNFTNQVPAFRNFSPFIEYALYTHRPFCEQIFANLKLCKASL